MVSAVVVISPPRSCDCLMCDFPSPPKSKELLASMTLERCRLDPETWKEFAGCALVQPDEDILPGRAAYDGSSWGIGINVVTSDEPLWYSMPDCVASALLTGKAPKGPASLAAPPQRADLWVHHGHVGWSGADRSHRGGPRGCHGRGAPEGEERPAPPRRVTTKGGSVAQADP
jgi:hypothetical protein